MLNVKFWLCQFVLQGAINRRILQASESTIIIWFLSLLTTAKLLRHHQFGKLFRSTSLYCRLMQTIPAHPLFGRLGKQRAWVNNEIDHVHSGKHLHREFSL